MKKFLYSLYSELAKKYAPEKEGEIIGDYSDILINDLEKRFGTLDYFRFLDAASLREFLQKRYLHVNQESLDYAVCKIMMKYADDNFRKLKKEEEKENFIKIVLLHYCDTDIMKAKYIIDHLLADDVKP